MYGSLAILKQLAIGVFGVFLMAEVAAAQSTNARRRPPRPRERDGKVIAVQLKTRKSGRSMKCPADFSDIGAITTDGPAEVKYTWVSSDGRRWPEHALKFGRGGQTSVSINWRVGEPGETAHVWLQLKAISPNEVLSNKSPFFVDCLK
jgi:hypothetical protein